MSPRKPAPKVAISSSQTALRVPRKRLTELVAFVARQERAKIAEVDLAVVNSDEISSLNRRYLRHPGPTDVLSFDLSDAGREGICAQIIVCGDVAAAQGRLHGLTPQRELMVYVIHGLLHLMGYEDESRRGVARMSARQDELLTAFCKQRGRK